MVQLWNWVTDPVHGVLTIVAGSGVGYFSKVMWEKLHHKVTGETKQLVAPKPLGWASDKVAQAYPADALRVHLTVADGTKIVLADRAGVRQKVEFDPGNYSARTVEERLTEVRIGVNSGAEALQYRTTPFDLAVTYPALRSRDDFFDANLSLTLNVRVDTRSPERLMTWHIAQDRQVTMDRVRSSVEAELKLPVTDALRSLALDAGDFAKQLAGKKAEFQALLNEHLGQHGLQATITACEVRSADYASHLDLARKSGQELRRGKIEELLRKERIAQAQGGAAAEEAVKILIQEGALNDLARMNEIAEARAYLRQQKEAETVICKLHAEAPAGPRHEVLMGFEQLRKQQKPFKVDLRVYRPGGTRDISVRPAASTAQNRIGDPLQLTIESEIPGYLYLLNLGTSGKLWRLFPNPWRKDNRIAAHQPLVIPQGEFELKFEGQPGTETVMAIVSAEKVDKLERLPVNADGMSVSPEMAGRDIRVLGQQLSELHNWAEATLLIETGAGQVSTAGAAF